MQSNPIENMSDSINYTFDDRVNLTEIKILMSKMDENQTDRFLAKSIFHYALRSESKEVEALECGINVTARLPDDTLIGFLRVVSDREYIHYIVDVMVSPDLQNYGVGTQLMNLTIGSLKKNGFIKIVLTSIPGKEDFYRKFGFEETMSPVLALRGEDYPVANTDPLFPNS